MSASKQYFAGDFPHQGRGAFLDVSARRRCIICGSDSWCQLSRDGGTALCKRVSAGSSRTGTNVHGAEYYVHHLNGQAHRIEAIAPTQTSSRASAARRDEVYRAFLSFLPLELKHRAALTGRGFRPEHIAQAHYASLPLEGRARIVRKLVERVGEPEGVPGFFVQRDGARRWQTFAGSPGLLVPVCSLEEQIVALKIRRDEVSDGPKYLFFTSASRGGAFAENALHVPVFSSEGSTLRITEGELKADAATVLSGIRTVSVPGHGSWKLALDAVKSLRPSKVLVALDADAATNVAVARSQLALVRALIDLGANVLLEPWPRKFKGVDEFLFARLRGEVIA